MFTSCSTFYKVYKSLDLCGVIFYASTHISTMASLKKCNSKPWQFKTMYKYRGRQHDACRTTTEEHQPTCARPNDSCNDRESDGSCDGSCDEEIDIALEFVSASEKKISFSKRRTKTMQ